MSCPACFSGHVHKGIPGGKIQTIHGLPTYVATPPEGVTPKGMIVLISDAFGWEFINNRILSDNYAEKGGFIVYLPDFMNGLPHPLPVPLLNLLIQYKQQAAQCPSQSLT
jgi:dienelactone hydrolase